MSTQRKKLDLDDLMTFMLTIPDHLEDSECEGVKSNLMSFNSAGMNYLQTSNKNMVSALENELANILSKTEECTPESKFQTVNLMVIDAAEAFRAHLNGDDIRMQNCIETVLKLYPNLLA